VTMSVTTPATPATAGAPVPTLDPTTGKVSVPAGTPAGTYTIDYQICEVLNPTNCDIASITVGVDAAPIVATDDNAASQSGVAGNPSVLNVLTNDTLNNVGPASLTKVALTIVTPSTNPGISLDPTTGVVSVAAGTPSGTYTITYQICELLNPTNCSTATVTVPVDVAAIVADNDSVSGVNGLTGGTNVVDALLGDTLNGVQATVGAGGTVTMSVTTPATPATAGAPVPTLDPTTGKVSVPAGTPAGTYTIDYQICEVLNPTNCDIASITVGVVTPTNTIAGVVYDDNNSNGVLDPTDIVVGGYTVNLYQGGTLVASVVANPDGSYLFPDVPTGTGYTIAAVDPVTGHVVTGAGSFDVAPGSNIANVNLPIDPSGIVYDSVTRAPIAGAVLTMTNATGTPLPVACFASPTQQGQTTLADGQYRFDIIAGADALCPVGETEYRLAIVSPAGYVAAPSATIAPLAGALDATICPVDGVPGGSCSVQPQPTPPTGALATTYYLAFLLTAGDPNVVHNHIPLDPTVVVPGDVTVTKTAQSKIGQRGGVMTYTIVATNNGGAVTAALKVIDKMPAGFTLIADSATLNGVAATPTINGRSVSFPGVTIPANGHVTIVLQLRIPITVAPGDYENIAMAVDPVTGAQIGTSGKATIRIQAEAVFDCSDIIGKVFDDKNSNGYQDKGELGIPGVRLATVRGELITTDKNGQYHVPCAMLPDQSIGSNFILKLDARTLPTGYRITTENPRTVRVTAGKVTKLMQRLAGL
jgi:large repetitive protein